MSMSEMLRLHYAPDNASLCVRLALQELGMTYETVLVDRRLRAHKSDAFLAMNPNGLIPVLETPHGPMFETAAIIIWLADRERALLPSAPAPHVRHAMDDVVGEYFTPHAPHPVLPRAIRGRGHRPDIPNGQNSTAAAFGCS